MLHLSILRGRLLNLAQAGVLLACLWKFLVLLIIGVDLTLATWSLWRLLGVTDEDLLAIVQAIQTRGPDPPRLTALFEYIGENEDALAAHFSRVRDGYALEMAVLFIAIAAALYISIVALRTYLFEGVSARAINAGENARLEQERLLRAATEALPPTFPKFHLRMARSTFIRRRWWRGLTLYLGNFAFALLDSGNRREFQFVLTHEAFHVRCGDSFFGIVTKSLRGVLSFAVTVGAFYLTFMWIVGWRGMPTILKLPTGFFAACAAAGAGFFLLRYFDAAIRRHKELLADQFASQAYPDVDLERVYRGVRPQLTHPKREDRLAFLRNGTTDTASATFFGIQEVVAFCMCAISPAPLAELAGPKLGALEQPALGVALCGLVVFAWEAWRTPVPAGRREAVIARGKVALVGCLVIAAAAGGSWFALAQIALITLILARIHRVRTPAVNVLTLPQSQTSPPEPVNSVPMVLFKTRSESSLSTTSPPLAARFFVTLSWIALVLGLIALFQTGVNLTLYRPFQREAFPMAGGEWRIWRGMILPVAATVAAARNIKRPAFAALLIEWSFYAAMIFSLGASGVWFYDLAYGRTPEQIMTGLVNMPWGDADKLYAAGPLGIAWWRVFLVTLFVQIPVAWLYVWRGRALYQKRRKETEDATFA